MVVVFYHSFLSSEFFSESLHLGDRLQLLQVLGDGAARLSSVPIEETSRRVFGQSDSLFLSLFLANYEFHHFFPRTTEGLSKETIASASSSQGRVKIRRVHPMSAPPQKFKNQFATIAPSVFYKFLNQYDHRRFFIPCTRILPHRFLSCTLPALQVLAWTTTGSCSVEYCISSLAFCIHAPIPPVPLNSVTALLSLHSS